MPEEPDEISLQSRRKIVSNEIKRVNYLLEIKESIDLTEHLQSIMSSLINIESTAGGISFIKYLDQAKRKELTKFCIRVIDCSKESITVQTRMDAVKILTPLVHQLSKESNTAGKTLKAAVKSLIKTLQPLREYQIAQGDRRLIEQDIKLKGLSANCLNQIDLKYILSPGEPDRLMRESLFSLADWCLTMEPKDPECAFQLLLDQFQASLVRSDDNLLQKEPLYTYPQVIMLLATLTELSEAASLFGGYRMQLDAMLNRAIKAGEIKDDHVVALNIIIAQEFFSKKSAGIGQLKKVAIDLLTESRGQRRAQIACMIIIILHYGNTNDIRHLTDGKYEAILTEMMIDDFIKKNDKLLAEVALVLLKNLQNDDNVWRKYIKGKEILILRKLVAMDRKSYSYNIFLRHFSDRIQDPQVSIEFDELARVRISENIDKLDELIRLARRDKEQADELEECLNCLVNLLRLRRHRLEDQAKELKLIELFDLMIDAKITTRVSPDPAILLVFANSYQVHPIVWSTLIKLLQYSEQLPLERDEKLSGTVGNPIATHRLLSHFIMIDTDYFYVEIASMEVLRLIMSYCQRATETSSSENLLKEILITWPRDFRKTKLNSRIDHRNMLNMFIGLHALAFTDKAPHGFLEFTQADLNGWNLDSLVSRAQFVDLLSGLVAVFSRHSGVTYDVMNNPPSFRLNRDESLRDDISTWTWLLIKSRAQFGGLLSGLLSVVFRRNRDESIGAIDNLPYFPRLDRDESIQDDIPIWTGLLAKHGDNSDETLRKCFNPIELATVVVAYACLIMISREERFYYCLEFIEPRRSLLKFIKSSCNRAIQRAPIDSIMSKRYQQMKDSLPTA